MHAPKETVNKKDFFLGFFSGMAITAIVCLIVLVVMQQMGRPLTATRTADQLNVPSVAVDGDPSSADDTGTLPEPTYLPVEVVDGDHMRGNPDAKITIVEYSDFQCPYCQAFHNTMTEIMETYSDDIRWVYRHFPLDTIHPEARPAAVASECAAEQDKFWEYADELYARQTELGSDMYTSLAEELGLDVAAFSSCVESGRYDDAVEQEFQSGIASGVQGTPGTFFNGQALNGAVPAATLKGLIESSK